MKVAVFDNGEEVIILAVKGRKKDESAIDGYKEWFIEGERDVNEYDITLAHIGAGEGVRLTPNIKTDISGKEEPIEDWFWVGEEED